MRDSSSVVFSFNLILFFEIVNQIKKSKVARPLVQLRDVRFRLSAVNFIIVMACRAN